MNISELNRLSEQARKEIIRFHCENKRSHCASSLSCIDMIIHLYFNKMKEGDTFILSKGHASSALYTVLKMKGLDVPLRFPAHPEVGGGVFCSSGSLGHGLPISCGVALAKPEKNVYVLCSDGELNEGSTWEAIQFAQHKGLANLTALFDLNGWQASGRCCDVIDLRPLTTKFLAFDFEAHPLDGNSHEDLSFFLNVNRMPDRPIALLCSTIKGKGLMGGEDSNEYHYRCPDEKNILQ